MAIALQILKIIGIVLLWVIGILLLLLLLILFWPYGYRIGATKKEHIKAYAGITWLLHFLTADLIYEDGVNLQIRILGITVYDKKKKAKKEEERLRREAEKGKKRREAEAGASPEPELPKEPAEETEAELDFLKEQNGEEEPELDFLKEQNEAREGEAEFTGDKETADTSGETEVKEGKLSEWKRRLSERRARREQKRKQKRDNGKKRRRKPDFPDWCEEKLDLLADKIEEVIDRIEDGTWDLSDTIDGAFDTYHYYERVLESEGTAWVVDYVKKHGMAIVKPLIPRRFDLDLDYRSTDPVHVAKVMQYYALSMPLTQDIRGKIVVTALPDEDSIEGETKLKGSFILGVLLWHAFLLWKNKKVRHFIKVIKREQVPGGKENGGKQK